MPGGIRRPAGRNVMDDENGYGADNVVVLRERARQTWKKMCATGAHGVLKANTDSALLALTYDHELRDCFAFDEMLRAPVVLREISGDSCERWMTDTDAMRVQTWLQQNGFPGMGLEPVRNALQQRIEQCSFHPVKRYLKSLVWDQVPRIGVWLPRYLGAPFNAYTQHIGRMFFVQMVARIIAAGCQADHMLVLEGAQGVLKSSACRVLGGQWFSDHLPEITNQREASQHLRGKWVIEVAEMHAMNKVEATQLKSFITRTTERYRPYWGRNEVIEPRQCVFVGTTNQDEYLKDPTGGRRFWPVRTAVDAPINLHALAEDRDQLFAEAVDAYINGDAWWPDQQFEREFISGEPAQRFAGDLWEDAIVAYIAARTRVTVTEIARDCLSIPSPHMNPSHGTRIGAILKERGWVPKRSLKARWWERMSP
jgi:predicted P-loop ATPase